MPVLDITVSQEFCMVSDAKVNACNIFPFIPQGFALAGPSIQSSADPDLVPKSLKFTKMAPHHSGLSRKMPSSQGAFRDHQSQGTILTLISIDDP